MKNPAEYFVKKPYRWIWLGITLFLMALLKMYAVDPDIVQFEFAWSSDGVQSILNQWGDIGRKTARINILIDFAYLVAYSVTIALFCLIQAERMKAHQGWWKAGKVLAWLQYLAAACDLVENLIMLKELSGNFSHMLPVIAGLLAGLKFLIVIMGLGYLLGSVIYLRIVRSD